MQEYILISSFVMLVLVFVAILIVLWTNPSIRKLALKNFIRKKKTTTMIILSFSVVTAVIIASLCLGDSVRKSMDEQIYANIGRVDEAIQSIGLFNSSFYNVLKNDTRLKEMTESISPLLVITSSAKINDVGKFTPKMSIIGYTQDFLNFGYFYNISGLKMNVQSLSKNDIIINEALAIELDAHIGDEIIISIRNPDQSIETLFSLNAPQIEVSFIVKSIVENKGLGRFQLGTSGISKNAYVPLSTLQNVINSNFRINTIILSNKQSYRTLHESILSCVKDILDTHISIQDAGFVYTVSNHIRLDNRNVFFSDRYLNMASEISTRNPSVSAISPLCTYFVEGIGNLNNKSNPEAKWIAYSTVEGFDYKSDSAFGSFIENKTGKSIEGMINDNEIIITNYTAEQLGFTIGSTLTLQYQMVNDAYEVKTLRKNFIVKYIIDMKGKAKDNGIPPYPGINGPIGNWKPPLFDLNWSMCGPYFDKEYWNQFAGAPKAYITLDTAKELWSNDLGSVTTLKIKSSQGYSVNRATSDFLHSFNISMDYTDAGIIIRDVRNENIKSSEGVQILTETFLSFGAVIIVSALIISIFFMNIIVEGRKKEIGIVESLGMRRGWIASILILEFSIAIIIAAGVGVIIGLFVSNLSVTLINDYVPNIVENQIAFHYELSSLFISFAVSIFICFIIICLFSILSSRIDVDEALRSKPGYSSFPSKKKPNIFNTIAMIIMMIFILSTTNILIKKFTIPIIYMFFVTGFLVVFISSIVISTNIDRVGKVISKYNCPIVKISLKNISRRKRTTMGMLIITALIIFTIMSLSIYSEAQNRNINDMTAVQGGGYDIYGETTSTIMFDLNNLRERELHGLNSKTYPNETSCIQFLSFGSLGGTCTNLRKNLPPRIIGMNNTFLVDNKMRFYSSIRKDNNIATWNELNNKRFGDSIPVIGDYNTVIWILQKDIGQKIDIMDEHGATKKIIIVAILENSIFQGALFTSQENIKSLYPTKAGYTIFLFKINNGNKNIQNIEAKLETALKSYGLDTRSVYEMALANIAVDISYISIFQALLIVGLTLGTAGIGLIAFREISERKYEIGILRSIGFRKIKVLDIFCIEYLYVVALGIAIGILSSLLLSYILFTSVVIPWLYIIALCIIVVFITYVAILYPAMKVSRMSPAEALRINE